MLIATHLKAENYEKKPWKNGGGESWEIARDSEDPFRWRLSLAKIAAAGPFSTYPGYLRQLVILAGGPVTLTDGEHGKKILSPLEVHAFPGEANVRATVGVPADDFNAYALVGKAKVGVYPTYFKPAEEMQFPLAGVEHFILCVAGTIELYDQNTDGKFTLRPRETLRLSKTDRREYLNVRARAAAAATTALWIVIHPR